MRTIRWVTAAAVMVSALLLFGSLTVVAVDRVVGDLWQYEFTMAYAGTSIEGVYTMTMEEGETVELAGVDYGAQVLSLRGTFYGTDTHVVPVSIEGGLRGITYEVGKDLAVVMDESTVWANLTYDFGSEQSTTREESTVARTFSPFWLHGFDTDEPAFSTSWVETVNRTTSTIEKRDGVTIRDDSEIVTLSYFIEVGDAFERCEIIAGEFEALEVRVASGDGIFGTYWWSEEVEYFVKQELYSIGDSEPFFAAELREYNLNKDGWLGLYVIVGVVAAVVAMTILGVVVMHKSRFWTVREAPPQEPPENQPRHPPSS